MQDWSAKACTPWLLQKLAWAEEAVCAGALSGLAPWLCPGAQQGCWEGGPLCPPLLWPATFKVRWWPAGAVGISYMRWDTFNSVGGRAGLLANTSAAPSLKDSTEASIDGKYPFTCWKTHGLVWLRWIKVTGRLDYFGSQYSTSANWCNPY